MINSKIETSNNDPTASNSTKRSLLAKDEISHQDIEDCGQAPVEYNYGINRIETGGDIPANIVEGDVNMLETEIVEGDHANKNNGERHHLAKKVFMF